MHCIVFITLIITGIIPFFLPCYEEKQKVGKQAPCQQDMSVLNIPIVCRSAWQREGTQYLLNEWRSK